MRKQAYLDNNKIGAENLTNNSESNDMGQGLPELMDCKQSVYQSLKVSKSWI